MSVFHWIPSAMLGKDWRPRCCGVTCKKNGHNMRARHCFGQYENYWLNAPENFKCTGECKTEYNSTSDFVMSQINAEDPELINIFPAHLSHKNAIDKKVMEIIVHCVVKGIGPAAFSDMMQSWHHNQWHKKYNEWLSYLKRWKAQPGPLDTFTIDEFEICPEYFDTLKMGGCIPSGQWLTMIFCKLVEDRRDYYDSEVLKRLRSTLILAIDASFKVPKWIMRWGGQKIYECLHSGMNEYNEVVLNKFSFSDNHTELGSNLSQLCSHGLEPVMVFTDNPKKDESLLKRTFENIQIDGEVLDIVEDNNAIETGMLSIEARGEYHYCYTLDQTLSSLNMMIEAIEEEITSFEGIKRLSLDAEWPVYDYGTSLQRSGNINHIILSSNVIHDSVIIELYNFENSPRDLQQIGQALINLFTMPFDRIVGNCHKSDYTSLQNQYPELRLRNTGRTKFVDVGQKAIDRGLTTRGKDKTTLQALCRLVNRSLKKPRSIRIGETWDCRNGQCARDALEYLHLDGEAPLVVDEALDKFPVITGRIGRHDALEIGTSVDIMPDSSKALQAIAQGEVVQLTGICSDLSYVKLRNDQVLIKVTKVFNHEGIIHYPHTFEKQKRCACGRGTHGKIESECDFYMFRQYGAPSFYIIELKSRLRKTVDGYNYPSCVYESGIVDNFPIGLTFGERRNARMTDFLSNNRNDDGGNDVAVIEEDANEADEIDEHSFAASINENVATENVQTLDEDANEFLADDSSDNGDDEGENDHQGTEEQIHLLSQNELNDEIERIIRDADRSIHDLLSTFDNEMTIEDIKRLDIDHPVLGDIFHLMDRAKVPTHHSFKAVFFRALRGAMFIMHNEDVEKVKQVLATKPNESWERKLAFDFQYIAKRVRRFAPPPTVLYKRLHAVYMFFRDKKDAKTGSALLNKRARKNFEGVLKLVKDGYASDPSGFCLYVQKTDNSGKQMIDKDGLPLYRSLRGTSNLESFHQYLTTSFGHTMAGPMYSDCILTVLRHFFNWRMSKRNRPNFPDLHHYDGLLIDRTNELYEDLFGRLKYEHWVPFNDSLPVDSPFGVVRTGCNEMPTIDLSEIEEKKLSLNPNLSYLAKRQQCKPPILPVNGSEEYKKFHRHMGEAIATGSPLNTFATMKEKWNSSDISISKKIFPKNEIQLCKHFKRWKKSRNAQNAEVASGANVYLAALHHVPKPSVDAASSLQNFQVVALQNPPDEFPMNEESEGEINDQSAALNDTNDRLVLFRRKRKRRTCKVKLADGRTCPNPETCRGRNDRRLCVLVTGDSQQQVQKTKRRYTKRKESKCNNCRRTDCKKGVRKRDKCENPAVCHTCEREDCQEGIQNPKMCRNV